MRDLNESRSRGRPQVEPPDRTWFAGFQELPRFRAVWCDEASRQAPDFGELWSDLCSGQARFLDTFFTDQRCYALLERTATGAPPELRIKGRRLQILERVLLGQSQKAVSIDLRLSASTVAGIMSGCLRTMGLRCRASNPPVLLVMAAHAAAGPSEILEARVSTLDWEGGAHEVVSAPRPDLDFPARLSNAELSVLRQLIEGQTQVEISRSRGTSSRTVANQLAASFRKLCVSGRGQLLGQLLVRTMQPQQARVS